VTEGFSRIDRELCTGCRNCVETCPVEAISGEKNQPQILSEERCVSCGRCVQVCSAYDTVFQARSIARAERLEQRGLPSGLKEPLFAAYDRCFLREVQTALADRSRAVLAHCGPGVCSALAEDFGLAPGSISPGKIVAALKKIGFRKVYDFSFAAALALLEEAYELLERLHTGKILPVINSSCPAGVKFIEQFHPELIHYLAGCKSPSQIAGALIKSYVAETLKLAPESIYSVSIGPCASRKYEASRPEMSSNGHPHMDAVLTARELAYLIKDSGIDILKIAEESFDRELPEIAGIENVYCTPGGIAEAVLRVGRSLLSQKATASSGVKFAATETEGVRFASAQLDRFVVKAVAVTGLPVAIPFFEAMKSGKNEVALLEILACPMGCVSGGGQPKVLLPQDKESTYAERAKLNPGAGVEGLEAIINHPALRNIYRDYFRKSCGDRSNRVLHTQYMERKLSK
jgi:NADP-reducing hydrogenase subunit HndD